jgi:uncharacterized protein YukE
MNGISITCAEVQAAAVQLNNLNSQMNEALLDMKREMNALEGGWISDAGENYPRPLQCFCQPFETQRMTISAYAKFLEQTAESYDSLENTINSNASGMQE